MTVATITALLLAGVTPAKADAPPVPAPAATDAATTWTTIFHDGFGKSFARGEWYSSRYAKDWYAYDGFADTSGHGVYRPKQVLSASNGGLDWYLRTKKGRHLVAAIVPRGANLTEGRYSFRFKLGVAKGYKIAFLLWPDSNDWGEGEIDYPELGNLVTGERVYTAVHPPNPGSDHPLAATVVTAPRSPVGNGWHTAVLERTSEAVTTYLDGEQVARFTENLPTASMHFVFQVETRIGKAPANPVKGHVKLAWARVEAPA